MSDLIERQAALDAIKSYASFMWEKYHEPFPESTIMEIIQELPSVTPQQKVGHWIWQEGYINYCKCSECGMGEWEMVWNFCPNCGAKMEVEE